MLATLTLIQILLHKWKINEKSNKKINSFLNNWIERAQKNLPNKILTITIDIQVM